MNILILGRGAREHALAWKIKRSPLVERVCVMPGSDHGAVIAFSREHKIDLVVVGSDQYLAEGIVDALAAVNILAFGPSKAAAEIEWSKAFAKQLMAEENIPTAASKTFQDYGAAQKYIDMQSLPIVIKASGLAEGKGVVIAKTQTEAQDALKKIMLERAFGDAGQEIVIEEFLRGKEISIHALCAGTDAILFPSAQDHKRAFDNDQGPNTGGMGTIVPVPGISSGTMQEIKEKIVLPALRGLASRGRAFMGLLYPSVMLANDGPKVIEYNARFGDPETESYMRLLKSDIVPALLAVARGSIEGVELEWNHGAATCVMLASAGYPGVYEKGKSIRGIEAAEKTGAIVFHAGTKRATDGTLLTDGGRVLAVTATGIDLKGALKNAYAAVENISFDGMQYRRDIGAKSQV